jgi:hypothetical protein
MRLRLGLALLLVIACGDDGTSDDKQSDAGVPEDARVDANMDAQTPPLDARIPDAQLDASGPLDAAQLPTTPASLSVQLQTTACFGTCPVYKVRVDKAGQVFFVGGSCSARPGVFIKTVEPAAVQGFYDSLRASPYFSLLNAYTDMDTCPTLASDAPGQIWDVIVEGVRKPLTYDQGCMGVPELTQIDPLASQLVATSQVQAWVGDGQACELFRGDAPLGALAMHYRLARDGKALGMVHFNQDGSFELEDCSGNVLATGFQRTGTYSSILIDQAERKLKFGELEFGSIVLLRPAENEAVVAYGLRENDELRLGIPEAEGCTAQ